MIGGNLQNQRERKLLSFTNSFAARSLKLQKFCIAFRNTAGVIEVAFFDSFVTQRAPQPELVDRIQYAVPIWKALPNMNSGSVGFGNVGAGGTGGNQFVALNTKPQNFAVGEGQQLRTTQLPNWAYTVYYDGNSTRVTPFVYFQSDAVFGSGQFFRPTILLCNDFSSAFPVFGTTEIPSGKKLAIDIIAFIA